VSVKFDTDLAGVGLDGGYFNAIGGTAIKAFARDGSLLGKVTNQSTGIEFLGLTTQDGSEQIAGLQFSLVGREPAGYAIDNLTFAQEGQVLPPNGASVPEPTTAIGAGLAFGLAALLKKSGNSLSA
jgi:F0F1-type ATP synthase membrane subunit c/vacuolar-type H+-ATPase subunit K